MTALEPRLDADDTSNQVKYLAEMKDSILIVATTKACGTVFSFAEHGHESDLFIAFPKCTIEIA